jgi:lysophospholipase L1-like esterase
MQQILVYGDSLTWGIIPNTRARLEFDERWPGVLENRLKAQGRRVRLIEDCLNGRRTVWEDPFKPGRNGLQGLAQRIEMHSPLALVILMLGTNDFQSMHPHTAWHAAQGIVTLVGAIRQAPVEPGMPIPPVLVVVPPPIGSPKGPVAAKFVGADAKCVGLAQAYREVTTELGCHLFDSGVVISSSKVDGVHLDADQHRMLGNSLVDVVGPLLTSQTVSEGIGR